jgi:hypothetical protein
MNALDKLNRFAAFINDSALATLPQTMVFYRSDDAVIRAVEMSADRELFSLLSEAEKMTYMTTVMQELIQRTHASSALFASEIKRTVFLRYESPQEAWNGIYPIVRDGGAIRLTAPTITPDTQIKFKDFFL